MKKLFGTDGVRGKAGDPPLDVPTIRRLGAALVRVLCHDEAGASGASRPVIRMLAGRDTRESGGWIERELAFGIRSQGGTLTSAGIIPTPAVAYLTPRMGYTAGVVISASHNPFEDNGIKVFSGAGEKFTEVLERTVEAVVADASWSVNDGEAAVVEQVDLRSEYTAHLREILPPDTRTAHMRLAVDCANGATTTVAPRLFEDLGFDVRHIGSQPDGRNINRGCGSTAPEPLAKMVVEGGYPLGVAFDGDGDRAIFVDGSGKVVDGDAVMLMCAKRMKVEGRLKGNAIVATVMSNIGLEIALKDAGIDIVRCVHALPPNRAEPPVHRKSYSRTNHAGHNKKYQAEAEYCIGKVQRTNCGTPHNKQGPCGQADAPHVQLDAALGELAGCVGAKGGTA